ncbi:MAG: class I SAM-dependent methyltransferase [Betaproteobacteria bacterium]|nr:class I SAM-dependent methyltransferase [Betaproteobacteria bacterium]
MSVEADQVSFDLPPPARIPAYLEKTYWWAYVHPKAVRFFERQWLVNAILWGNFSRLRDAALDELGQHIEGRTLQIACVYGDFSPRVMGRLAPGATLDVVDVLPIQLDNLRKKLAQDARVTPVLCDSADLRFADATYDQTILFFLLHEQPEAVRRRTLSEAVRVTRPGGRIVIVDYHLPKRFHPLRYLFRPVLHVLEPFALDLWNHDLTTWLPETIRAEQIRKETSFGGLYQKVVITV